MLRNITDKVSNQVQFPLSANGTVLDRVQTATKTTSKSAMNSHLGMLLWALIVGSSFPAVGMMSEGLPPPLLLTAIRFTVAALAILPLVWGKSDRLPN
jgi:hypothetical protein